MTFVLAASLIVNALLVLLIIKMNTDHRKDVRWIYMDWAVRFRLGEMDGLKPDAIRADRFKVLIAESLRSTGMKKDRGIGWGVKP